MTEEIKQNVRHAWTNCLKLKLGESDVDDDAEKDAIKKAIGRLKNVWQIGPTRKNKKKPVYHITRTIHSKDWPIPSYEHFKSIQEKRRSLHPPSNEQTSQISDSASGADLIFESEHK